MIGSSMVRGRSVRILATASRTSFSARSLLTSSRSSTSVVDAPSVTEEVMCFTPDTLAIESSILRVTCVSSSAGAAPACVTVTDTTGTSTLGARVIGMARNETDAQRQQHGEQHQSPGSACGSTRRRC